MNKTFVFFFFERKTKKRKEKRKRKREALSDHEAKRKVFSINNKQLGRVPYGEAES